MQHEVIHLMGHYIHHHRLAASSLTDRRNRSLVFILHLETGERHFECFAWAAVPRIDHVLD